MQNDNKYLSKNNTYTLFNDRIHSRIPNPGHVTFFLIFIFYFLFHALKELDNFSIVISYYSKKCLIEKITQQIFKKIQYKFTKLMNKINLKSIK